MHRNAKQSTANLLSHWEARMDELKMDDVIEQLRELVDALGGQVDPQRILKAYWDSVALLDKNDRWSESDGQQQEVD